jgi:CRP/FNR family transcriptional regulator
MRENDPCRGFFVVARGGARVFRLSPEGRQQVLHHLRAGHAFAEAALLDLGYYPASGEATETPTRIVEVKGRPFLELFRSDDQLAAAMVGSLCIWLQRLIARVDELSVASAGARLAHHLVQLPGRGSGEEVEVELPMSKKDLAAHLSITPETLSRLLRRWRERGILRSEGRRLVILDSDTLQAVADGADSSRG